MIRARRGTYRAGNKVGVPVAVALAFLTAGPARAQPQVTFAAEGVTVSGLAPGGQVAWWAVSHEPQAYHLRIARRGGIETDADADGAVTLPGFEVVAQRTVVAVVDLGSGEPRVAAPEGFSPGELVLEPEEELAAVAPGEPGRLVARREGLEVLYTRPGAGAGAWALSAKDGAATDGDGVEDGFVEAELAAASPLGASPGPPGELEAGDSILTIDPRTLEVLVASVSADGSEEAP